PWARMPSRRPGAEGAAMSVDDIIALLDETLAAGEDGAHNHSALTAPPPYPADLTAREVAVLRLVTQGLTSAQVADQLVISVVTVNTPLRNIYSKIGVNSRTAAARWAIEHGLG